MVFAGFAGAAAATVLGTVANDSGAVLLMIGTGFLLACGAFALGQSSATKPLTGASGTLR